MNFRRLMSSLVRQRFSEKCEQAINLQINRELYAGYNYLSMAYHFQRTEVAFPGLFKFFKNSSKEEQEHAEKFMEYLNLRGGTIILSEICKPNNEDWGSPADAIATALDMEKEINEKLLELSDLSEAECDPHLNDFLVNEYLIVQVNEIKKLSDLLTNVKRCECGLGEFIFDKELKP